jgi:hypothetical protein
MISSRNSPQEGGVLTMRFAWDVDWQLLATTVIDSEKLVC